MNHYQRSQFISWSLVILLCFAWSIIILRYLIPATLPFWFGLAEAFLLKPIILWFRQKLKLQRKSAAFSVLFLFYLLLCLLLWSLGVWIIHRGGLWIQNLPQHYSQKIHPFLHRCALQINGVLDDISPQAAQLLVEKSEEISAIISSNLASASSAVLAHATGIAKQVPFWFTTITFTILCSVFISMDYPAVSSFLLRPLPPKWQAMLLHGKQQVCRYLFQLLKAYLILLLFTFLQLSIGFFSLGVTRPLLWAAVIAVLDFLPFIGTGLILLPWGLYQIVLGRVAFGSGFLLLWLLITLVRNILEPKLLSRSIGVHPLAILVSMYAGLRLWGFVGLLLAPLLALLFSFWKQENKTFSEK